MNPYYDSDFFSFFLLFFSRLFYRPDALAADELQVWVLITTSVSCALVGTFLVLRRLTMLANAVSHTLLLGIALVLLLAITPVEHLSLGELFIAALIASLLTAFLVEWLTYKARVQEDASIGLIFSALFALGITLITAWTPNAHIGTEAVMGNIDAIGIEDLHLAVEILVVNVVLFTLFFKEWVWTTFDPIFAKLSSGRPAFFHMLLLLLVAVTLMGAFRSVGVLMVLTFITAPPLTARLFTHRVRTLLFLAMGVAAVGSIVSVALARHLLTVYGLALSTGALTVVLLGVVYMVCLGVTCARK